MSFLVVSAAISTVPWLIDHGSIIDSVTRN